MEGIVEELRQRALSFSAAGREVLALSPAALEEIARKTGQSLRSLEIVALEQEIVPERYLRNLGTLGWAGQRRLLQACVAVVGCGGLGGGVIEGLARSGVGCLIVVDGDRFVPHNLNRQLLSTVADLGQYKVEAAAERVAAINPAVEVVAHPVLATAENLVELLKGAEVAVDALDTPADRLVLQDAAGRLGIPLVHGAIAGLIGQVATIFPGDETLTSLYGMGQTPAYGAEFVLGTPAPTPMLVAACQVAEVLKFLLGRGELLRGQLLFLDLESGVVERFPLRHGEE